MESCKERRIPAGRFVEADRVRGRVRGSGLTSIRLRCESSRESADFADARQTRWRITNQRRLDLRTEVGWVPCPRLRDRDEVFIQSRDAKPLNRYFPELLDPIRSQLTDQC